MTGGNPIIAGFSGLTRFSGRDRPGRFWPYAGIVLLLAFVIMMAAMAVTMVGIFQEMSAFATAHPDSAVVTSSPGHYSIQVDGAHPEAPMPDMSVFLIAVAVSAIGAVLLLAAAVCRRLHDTGRAGWWGLMPVPFLLFGVIVGPIAMRDAMMGHEDMTLFTTMFFNNLIYMVALIVLVVLLVLPSKPANRYGPRPE